MTRTTQVRTALILTTALAWSASATAAAADDDAAPTAAPAADTAAADTAAADTAAADASSAPESAADPAAPAGEIVVTGERANQFGTDTVQAGSFRNAKILDVPMTVAVVPDAVLKSQQAVDLIDAVRNTPGVSSSAVSPVTYNNLTIRGISVDVRSSYKMDGQLNILSSTAFPLEDKDRVEILKGASALYYGFSPPSGIINLVMKRPTRELTLAARAFGDSNGGYGGHIDVGDTIGIFGFRVNLLAAHRDTGIEFSQGERYLASGSFDLRPTDHLTITADTEWFKNEIIEPPVFIIPNGATAVPDVKRLNPRHNIGGLNWTGNNTEEYNYLVKAVYQFNKDWDITGSYGRSHLRRQRDNPGFVPANFTTAIDPTNPLYGSGKIRWSTTTQDAVYDNVNYAAELHGVVHLGDFSDSILVGASRSLRELAGSPATPRTLMPSNFTDPIQYPDPDLPLGVRPPPSTTDDQGLYVFNQLNYKEVVQVLGGVRFSDYYNEGSTNSAVKTPYKAKPVSLSGGLVVKPVSWISAYGTYIEGVEENAIASNNVDNAQEVFPPISSTLYEAGLKLQPHKNLLVQLSYFDIKREGAYNERNIPGTAITHGYGDATQTYRGFEASVTGYLTKDLAINAAANWLKARTYQAEDPTSVKTRPGGTPKNSWTVSGEYTLSWLDPGLRLSAGVFHTGSQALDDTNNLVLSPYTTFDLGGSYQFQLAGHDVTMRVNAQNISGKRYWASVSSLLAESLPSVVKFSVAVKY